MRYQREEHSLMNASRWRRPSVSRRAFLASCASTTARIHRLFTRVFSSQSLPTSAANSGAPTSFGNFAFGSKSFASKRTKASCRGVTFAPANMLPSLNRLRSAYALRKLCVISTDWAAASYLVSDGNDPVAIPLGSYNSANSPRTTQSICIQHRPQTDDGIDPDSRRPEAICLRD